MKNYTSLKRHYSRLAHDGSCRVHPECQVRYSDDAGEFQKSMSAHVWLPLARHWKIPIAEIKKIVKGTD